MGLMLRGTGLISDSFQSLQLQISVSRVVADWASRGLRFGTFRIVKLGNVSEREYTKQNCSTNTGSIENEMPRL